MFTEKVQWQKANKEQQEEIQSLSQITFKKNEFHKTRYEGIHDEDGRKVFEFRTEDDARRLWVDENNNFYED